MTEKTTYNFRLPLKMLLDAHRKAKAEVRTLSAVIRALLDKWLKGEIEL